MWCLSARILENCLVYVYLICEWFWDDFQNHFRHRNPNTINFWMYSYSILVGAWWPSWSRLGTESGHFSIYPTEFKSTIGFYIIPCNSRHLLSLGRDRQSGPSSSLGMKEWVQYLLIWCFGGVGGRSPPTRIKCARFSARFDSSIYLYIYI